MAPSRPYYSSCPSPCLSCVNPFLRSLIRSSFYALSYVSIPADLQIFPISIFLVIVFVLILKPLGDLCFDRPNAMVRALPCNAMAGHFLIAIALIVCCISSTLISGRSSTVHFLSNLCAHFCPYAFIQACLPRWPVGHHFCPFFLFRSSHGTV